MSGRDDSNPQDGTEKKIALRVHKEGLTVVDNYQLIERIGEGSFGQVWRAKKGKTEVALKILKGSMEPDEVKRELKSLEALKELHHPYLLETHDFWSDEDQLYIEMEIAEGSLKDRLKACQDAGSKGIPAEELLKYFGEIAQGLDYLHGRRPERFLHRDIKPANILLIGGCAKLADFGLLRKIAGDRSGTKTQGGTPGYMAPEAIKTDDASVHTDLFSLAVTYAELRQGRMPFAGQTQYQIYHSILHSPPDLDRPLHPEEKAVLLKAMSKEPDRRHSSCGEFVANRAAVPVGLNAPTAPTPVAPETGVDHETSAPNAETYVPGRSQRSANLDRPSVFASQPASTRKPSKLIWLAPLALVMVAAVIGTAFWFLPEPDTKESPDKKSPPVPIVPTVRKIAITTIPPGATVSIDDKIQESKTNGVYEVSAGDHGLRLSLPGYKDAYQNIGPGEDKINITLEKIASVPIVRKLEIKTNPAGATVFIDGKEQAQKTNGLFEIPDRPYQLRLVIANYKEVQQTIDPAQKEVDVALVKIESMPGRAFALLIGVHQPTPQLPDFVHAESDVSGLGRVLIAGGYSASQVQVLTQGQADPPTASQIRESLKKLTKGCASADTLVLALVGHVIAFEGQRESYFCPAGSDLANKTTLISVAEIFDQLKQCPAQSKVVLLDGWRTDLFVPPELPGGTVIVRERLPEVRPPDGVTLFTSCAPGERASQHPQERHGLFFHSLIRGLQGAADVGPKRQITFDSLVNYTIRQVADDAQREFKLKQTPELLGAKTRLVFVQTEVLVHVNEGLLVLEKDNAKAVTAFTLAEAKNPDYLDLYLGRAEAYSSSGKDDPGNFDKAIQDCQSALKRDPRNAAALGTLAQIESLQARQQKRADGFQTALEHHNRAIQLDPQWAKAYNARGMTQAMRRDYPLAIKDYTEAIRFNPKLKVFYENRGFAYTTQKDYDNAITDFDQAILIDATNPLTFARRGNAYRNLGMFERALNDFNKAVDLNPRNPNSLYGRGLVQVARKDFDKAIEDFTTALSFVEDKETLCNRGFAYNEKGFKEKNLELYDKAIQDLTAALKLSPQYVPALYFRGVAYQNKARQSKNDAKLYEQAIKDFSQAIDQAPLHANAWYGRGLAYQAIGQKARGDADLKKAREIDPKVGQTPGVPEARLDSPGNADTLMKHYMALDEQR